MTQISLSEWASALVKLAEARVLEARKTIAFYDRLIGAGVPKRAVDTIASKTARQCPAIDQAIAWAKRGSGTVVFSGPVGTGKTVAATRYAANTQALWCHAGEFGRWSWSDWRAHEEQLVRAHRLVIDDVGVRTSPTAGERIGSLLANRHDAGRPTVATTNFGQAPFAELVDGVSSPATSPVLDRVRDDGAWIDVGGPSRRGGGDLGGAATPVAWIEVERALDVLVELVDGVARGEDGGPDSKRALRGAQEVLEVLPLGRAHLDHGLGIAACESLERYLGASADQVEAMVLENRARVSTAINDMSSESAIGFGSFAEAFGSLRWGSDDAHNEH